MKHTMFNQQVISEKMCENTHLFIIGCSQLAYKSAQNTLCLVIHVSSYIKFRPCLHALHITYHLNQLLPFKCHEAHPELLATHPLMLLLPVVLLAFQAAVSRNTTSTTFRCDWPTAGLAPQDAHDLS